MIKINGSSFSKLNLGSGRDPSKKLLYPWLNVDVDGPAADVLHDIRRLPTEWQDSFDEVRASHVLEHLFLEDMEGALAEWRRVLLPGGKLRVIVPDLVIVAKALLEGRDSKGRRSVSVTETTPVLAQVYGVGYETSQTEDPWRHRFLFDEDSLRQLLLLNGFRDVVRYGADHDPANEHSVKDDSQNPFSLCLLAYKPEI